MQVSRPCTDEFKAFLRKFPVPVPLKVWMEGSAREWISKLKAYRDAVLDKPWNGEEQTLPHFVACSCVVNGGSECDCGTKALMEQQHLKFRLQRAKYFLKAYLVPVHQGIRMLLDGRQLSHQEISAVARYVRGQQLVRKNHLIFLHPDLEVAARLGLRVSVDLISELEQQNAFDSDQ